MLSFIVQTVHASKLAAVRRVERGVKGARHDTALKARFDFLEDRSAVGVFTEPPNGEQNRLLKSSEDI